MTTENLPTLPPITLRVTPARIESDVHEPSSSATVALVPYVTLSLWMSCVVVGILGIKIPYPKFMIASESLPVSAKIIHVELTQDDASPGTDSESPDEEPPPAPPDAAVQPPTPPEAITPPAAPPMATVAVPSPEIAFAIPVQGPARTVDAKQAVPVPARPADAGPAPAAVRHLRFGHGEGAQPSPEYPREAQLGREEGVVGIRFTVDATGKVTSAELAPACRWPMLNQAALRAVRDRWYFAPGDVRVFQVSIEFKLIE